MLNITLFCEDSGHEAVIKAILLKLATKGMVKIIPLSTHGGKGRALYELGKYFEDIERGRAFTPDAIVVAIDANCIGYSNKRKEIDDKVPESLKHIPLVHAIPDPHVERWLLLDSHAFKQVFGKGCNAPDQKCQKDRYKILLREAIQNAGGVSIIGGIEHAEEIVKNMDLSKLKRLDDSIKKFIEDMENLLNQWR